jgi:iron-regulated transporter 1
MNSQMRRIDLICKLFGPLFISFIDGISTKGTLIVIFAMNVSSLIIEYYTIALVYRDIPELQKAKNKKLSTLIEPSAGKRSRNGLVSQIEGFIGKFVKDFSFYHQHHVFLPSFAVAILSLTVLNFSGQMITYLLALGYKSTDIGIARTFGTLLEFMATWLAPWLIGLLGPVRAGLCLSLWQLIMLVAGTMVFFLADSDPSISIAGLVIGTILSRLGLRGLILCIQIIVQQVSDHYFFLVSSLLNDKGC